MANWDKIKEKWDVEDRRWLKMSSWFQSIWISGIIMLLAVWYFWWAEQALNLLWEMTQNWWKTEVITKEFDWNDDYEKFTKSVLWSSDSMWKDIFKKNWLKYTPPKLVLFRGFTNSACWWAESNIWPHYCSVDRTIYMDETFFKELSKKFWAKWGDVAEWYVIAHEVWHHVQNELWILSKAHSLMRKNPREKNKISISLELQADCFAWIWGGNIESKWILEKWEIEEAIDAAKAVWDDNIQEKINWEIQPEQWNHGSSKDRKKWFEIGYDYQDFKKCDTFN